MRKYVFLFIWFLFAQNASADLYVRDGGTSSACTTWTDACDQLTTAEGIVTRGETIWVADGTYTSVTFDVAESGTSIITVQKATASAHGTETGWSSTYGDGQAVLGELIFITGYITIDGVARNESSWNTASSYGFTATGVSGNRLSYGACGDSITIQYVSISPGGQGNGRPVYIGGFAGGTTGCANWTIRRSYIHDGEEINIPGGEDVLFEYNYISALHSKECIRGQVSLINFTVRHSVFHDCCRDEYDPGTGCTAEVALFRNLGDPDINEFEGFKFYGNVIRKTISQHKTDASVMAQAADCLIYNNTIYDDSDTGTGSLNCESGAGSEVRNNILYFPNGMTGGFTAATASNNSTYTSSPPLTNVGTGDFHLTQAVAGYSLSSPYNTDMDGVTRGGDGTFDIGAFEYGVSTGPTLSSPPSSATGLAFPIVFDWSDFENAIKYQLQVDDNSDWSSPEIDTIIDCEGPCGSQHSTYSADDTELDPGVHYYWRVRALH